MTEDLEKEDRGDELLFPDEVVEEEKDTKVEEKAEKEEQTEEETKAEKDEVEEEEEPRKPRKTAKDRIQELIAKNKEKESQYLARIAELEEIAKKVKTSEEVEKVESKLEEMEEQYASLIADGELKKAAALRKEMRNLERLIVQKEAEQQAMRAKDAAKEEIKYDATVSALEEMYPQINPESDEYDEDTVKEILAIHQGLVLQGTSPSTAIQKAVKYVLGSPQVAESKQKAEERTKESKKKVAEVMKKQPAMSNKAGIDSDKAGIESELDVSKLSDKDFEKLPESVIAKLRGDFV